MLFLILTGIASERLTCGKAYRLCQSTSGSDQRLVSFVSFIAFISFND